MERLTFDGNFCDIAQCESVPGGSYCENGNCSQREVWERLKAYEDAGLSPAACAQARRIEDRLNEGGSSIKTMVELMVAYDEGRVTIAPKAKVVREVPLEEAGLMGKILAKRRAENG